MGRVRPGDVSSQLATCSYVSGDCLNGNPASPGSATPRSLERLTCAAAREGIILTGAGAGVRAQFWFHIYI